MSTEANSIPSLNLNSEVPRSPRESLGGYVIAGRTLDKCRAEIAGTLGEYHFDCPLDNLFLDFIGVTADEFRAQVATGASDDEMAEWIREKSRQTESRDVIQWNNDLRYKRISEMPIELQEFLEEYIPKYLPDGKIVYYWFDVYDIEEGRI